MMLGRRPDTSVQQQAFGHLALDSGAQKAVESVVQRIVARALAAKPINYDPDDTPGTDEVMVRPLTGIDHEFQPAAPWSFERAVTAVAAQGKPTTITRKELK